MRLPASYQLIGAAVDDALRDVDGDLARRAYDDLMAARPARLAQLAALVPEVGLDANDGPARLGAVLLAALASPPELTPAAQASIACDVALWLGDRCIAAAPHLTWTFYTAHKKATGYQRAVLTGFRAVDDERYYVDVAHLVSSWIDLAARGRRARPDFLAVIAATVLRDAG